MPFSEPEAMASGGLMMKEDSPGLLGAGKWLSDPTPI